ncbi:ParA family protein [Paenibacillus chitinolyticus]
MSKVIALANQKGGVGKTTTAFNLGIGLAAEGKKVLLLEADAQGNLTEEPYEPKEGILHHHEGIDLMPGNIELSAVEVALVNTMSRESIMRSYIDYVKEDYDYILIDCMPSLGKMTISTHWQRRIAS